MAEAPKKDEIIPDRVPVAQAINDHLNALHFLTADRQHFLPVGTIENGKTIITWTRDTPIPGHKELEDYQLEALKRVFGEIENGTSIEFREVKGQADIHYMQGKDDNTSLCHHDSRSGRLRSSVVMSTGLKREDYAFGCEGYGALLHETLHALGLTLEAIPANTPTLVLSPKTPKEIPAMVKAHNTISGYNALYSRDGSPLSYIEGATPSWTMAPYALAALQYKFGKPQGEVEGQPKTIDANVLSRLGTLWAAGPLSLDFSNFSPPEDGFVAINLGASDFKDQIYYQASGLNEKGALVVKKISGTRIALDTHLLHVMAGPKTSVRLFLTGDPARANYLRGGAKQDRLTAVGGHDVLVGGEDADEFIFSARSGAKNSGAGNLVMDFNRQEKDVFLVSADNVEVQQRNDYMVYGKPTSGTELRLISGGNVTASAFVVNATPADVLASVVYVENPHPNMVVHPPSADGKSQEPTALAGQPSVSPAMQQALDQAQDPSRPRTRGGNAHAALSLPVAHAAPKGTGKGPAVV